MDSFADHPDVPVGKETSGYEVSWDGLHGANPLYKNFSRSDRTVHLNYISWCLEMIHSPNTDDDTHVVHKTERYMEGYGGMV